MPKIMVAGSALMDIYLMLERHASIGESVIANGMRSVPGGKGLNVAVAASKLGSHTHFVGKIAKDQFGSYIDEYLSKHKISTHLAISKDEPTGMAVIAITNKAEVQIMIVYGANGSFEPSDLGSIKIDRGDVLIGQMEIPYRTTERFFEMGRKAGAINIFNMSPIRELSKRLVELTDILLVNEVELVHFSGHASAAGGAGKEEALEMMRAIRARDDQIVVATMGGRGAVALKGRDVFEVKGRKVKVVDTTGAGDCFLAAFATQISKGSSLEHSLEYANAAASICVQRMGTSSAMPDASEVDKAMASSE